MGLQGNDTFVFEHLHFLLDEQERADGSEKRSQLRSRFSCTQLIAECSDDRYRPSAKEFEKRECYDISPKGLAYFSPFEPSNSHVMVALGKAPFLFLLAKVCRSKQLDDGRWLVGCRFLKKLR